MIGLSEGRKTQSSLWSCFQLLLPTTFLLNLCQQCQVCLFSRFLMNSIEHPFSFLQYAKQLILNYFFHSVAWLFCIMEGGLVESYNQNTTHIIRKKKKKPVFFIKKIKWILLSFFAFIHILPLDAQESWIFKFVTFLQFSGFD